jgi:hypothetical protein
MTQGKSWTQERPKTDKVGPKALLTLSPIFGLIRLPFHNFLVFSNVCSI